ncbi:MAG TPA: hypothetical protein VMM18_04020 [Gemmatimonadaceae bacterium]|nr:hypothetical protein [Gemmatimonadaceae bacterium]
MRHATRAALLALLATTPALAQSADESRSGPRPILPREFEIALARSAAPPTVSAQARVLVLTDQGFVVADSGSNGVTCLVDRSWRRSLEPHCYDAEGAASILPMELRRTEMRHRGRPEDEIDRDLAAGLANGRFRLPRRPALTYMMSAGQVLYDDSGRSVGAWRPHLMIYHPYLTNAELGLPEAPDFRVGAVFDQGTPRSTLVIIMAEFVAAPLAASVPDSP